MRLLSFSPQMAPTHKSHLNCCSFTRVRRMSRNYIGTPRSPECSLRPLPTLSTLSRLSQYRSCLLLHLRRHGLPNIALTTMFMHLQLATRPVFVCFIKLVECYNVKSPYLLVGLPKLALLELLCLSHPSPNSLHISLNVSGYKEAHHL